MAFLDVVSELLGFGSDAKGWSLVGQDAGFKIEFKGQYIAQSLTENVGAVLGDTSSVGKDKPNFQWLQGEAETATFTTRLFARDSFKSVRQEIELLKSMARKNDSIKRAPIFLFTMGSELSFTCFVRGVRLVYDETRSDGSLRGAVVDLTLQKIDEAQRSGEFSASFAAKIKSVAGVVVGIAGVGSQLKRVIHIPGGSLHTIDRTYQAKHGDTFEQIAKREYGNPLVGDVLRRAQPDKEPLHAGDIVQLVEPTEIIQIRVTPQSVCLKNTAKNLALRQLRLDAKDKKTTIFI